MNNIRTCPKCQSTVFIKVDNSREQQLNPIKIGTLTIAEISRYVCYDCGFIE